MGREPDISAHIASAGRVYDITAPLRPGMTVWPGDPELALTPVFQIAAGDEANVSLVSLSTHTGTHVDAPWHFSDDGARLDEIPIDRWIGPCIVGTVPEDTRIIRAEHLEAIAAHKGLSEASIVVIKTRPDDAPPPTDAFNSNFAALDLSAAHWLIAHGVTLIGIDTPSVEEAEGDGEVHRVLLGKGVLIVEGLDLRGIPTGPYTLICLPLRLVGADGAPARVLLLEQT